MKMKSEMSEIFTHYFIEETQELRHVFFRGLRRNVGNLWKNRLLHWTNSGPKKNNFFNLIFLWEFARFSVGGQSYCHFLTTGSAENEVWMNRFWKWGPICSEFCPLCSWDKTWPKKYCVKEFCCRLLDSIVGPFSTSMRSGNNLRRLVRVLRHRSEFCPLCPNSELRARLV